MEHGQASKATDTTRCMRADLLARYRNIRSRTGALTKHLTPEDMLLQAMPDASPTRWHLAHTSWFFEEFVLQRFEDGFTPYDPHYAYLFNSYYNSVGEQWPRDKRGLLSRPAAKEVFAYRWAVDERIERLLGNLSEAAFGEAETIITLGINHEEQHQELLCTDIKAAFALNPFAPAASAIPEAFEEEPEDQGPAANDRWVSFEGGIHAIGYDGEGFAFDNETKRHKVFLDDFSLHGTPVTNGQFLAFVEDGGYRDARLWLAEGWDWLSRERVEHPIYWRQIDGVWFEFTLHGLIPLRPDRILSHVSAYEAFAFAEWAGARLPREAEVEVALGKSNPSAGQFLDPDGFIHPHLVGRDNGLGSAFGTVWDWTQSAYSAYPGFRPAAGAIGEYNGKFMSSQLVLKGGSCATPPGHIRATYRNFFPPDARWQFTGIRLARDV